MGRPSSSARGLARVTSAPTPSANIRSPVAATSRAADTAAPIATDLPTATDSRSSSGLPSASWVTPCSIIRRRIRWYWTAASVAPSGSATGTWRAHGLGCSPYPSSSASLPRMIEPASPPTASRQLNVRPQARAMGSSLRWARTRWAATPRPMAATLPTRTTPRWVIRRCGVSGPRPMTFSDRASISDCEVAVSA